MKVRELKAVLAGADDDADVIVTKQTTAGGAAIRFKPDDVFETVGASLQPSGKVGISYDESRKTDF